jgi:hypothetical protein
MDLRDPRFTKLLIAALDGAFIGVVRALLGRLLRAWWPDIE